MQVKMSDLPLKSVSFLPSQTVRIEGPHRLTGEEPLSTANLWEHAQAIYRSLTWEDQQDVDPLMKRLHIALSAAEQAYDAGISTSDFCALAVDAYWWIYAWAENIEQEQAASIPA